MRSTLRGDAPVLVLALVLATAVLPAPALAAVALATGDITALAPGEAQAIAVLPGPATPSALVPPPIMSGWPQLMGTTPNFSPVGVTLADVDANGDLEVVAGSTDGLLRVWNHDGTLLSGWPVALGGQIQSKAAAADLDGNGDLEILIAVKTGQLHILHHDGTPLSGWPRPWGGTFGFIAPTVANLDGDGVPEVLIGGGGTVYAYHADGSTVTGWPRVVGGTVSGTLAVGDVVGDSRPEIFAVTASTNMLHGLAADGTVLPGWPQATGLSSSWAAPSIGDLDHDGSREVLVVGYSFGNFTRINAYRGDGTAFPNFPLTYPSVQTYSCPVLGDVDGDLDLEIFNAGKVSAAPSFYAWDHMGAVLPGWPLPLDNMEGSAIVANFDGEAQMEIVIGDNYTPGQFHGYNVDGSNAADFPFPKLAASLPNSPALGDVDMDGDLDMAMTGSTGAVAIWDFATVYNADAIEWGTLFHDNWHTNQHGFVIPGGGAGIAGSESPGAATLRLGLVYPNPAFAGTTIPFELGRDASVRLTILDVAGRTVRTLADRTFDPGAHRLRWDGRNDRGQAVAGGIYWVRLDAPGTGTPPSEQKVVIGR